MQTMPPYNMSPHEAVSAAMWMMIGAHEGVGQKVKWSGAAYYHHPLQTHRLLVELCTRFDIELTWEEECAMLLHDVVEDTDMTLNIIEHFFGPVVMELVEGLTDVAKPEDGNRAARIKINREHSAKAPAGSKKCKISDLCCNTRSIVEQNRGFAHVYLPEKRLLLEEALNDVHPKLLEYAWQVVREAEERLVQLDLEEKERLNPSL